MAGSEGEEGYWLLRPTHADPTITIPEGSTVTNRTAKLITESQAEAMLTALRGLWSRVEGTVMMNPQVRIVEAVVKVNDSRKRAMGRKVLEALVKSRKLKKKDAQAVGLATSLYHVLDERPDDVCLVDHVADGLSEGSRRVVPLSGEVDLAFPDPSPGGADGPRPFGDVVVGYAADLVLVVAE